MVLPFCHTCSYCLVIRFAVSLSHSSSSPFSLHSSLLSPAAFMAAYSGLSTSARLLMISNTHPCLWNCRCLLCYASCSSQSWPKIGACKTGLNFGLTQLHDESWTCSVCMSGNSFSSPQSLGKWAHCQVCSVNQIWILEILLGFRELDFVGFGLMCAV